MVKPIEITPLYHSKPFWHHNSHEVVLASSLKLLRNLNKFQFVTKADEKARRQLLKFISSALLEHKKLTKPQLFSAEATSGECKELLVERYLFTEGINQAYSGEAFVLDQSGMFLGIINLVEHLQLQLIDQGDRIDDLLQKLASIESNLSESLDFAYHNRFGFLTAVPYHCGTGLIASMILHLPALIHQKQLDNILKKHHQEEVQAFGLGDEKIFTADLVILQNKPTIGVSEEKIVSSLQSLSQRLCVAEISSRKALQLQPDEQILDKISRSFGLARHSYKIDTAEAMEAMSLIKLGAHLGLVTGLNTTTATKLLFDVQRAHLKIATYKDEDSQDLSHARALFLHKQLSNVQLSF